MLLRSTMRGLHNAPLLFILLVLALVLVDRWIPLPLKRSGRVAFLAWCGSCAAVLAVLLAPVSAYDLRHRLTPHWSGCLNTGMGSIRSAVGLHNQGALNVVLFVPFALLSVLVVSRWWEGLILVVAVAVLAELAQGVLPALGRTCATADLTSYAIGIALGSALGLSLRAATKGGAARLVGARSEQA